MSSIGLVVFRNKALQESAVNNAINISNNSDEVKPKEVVISRKKPKSQPPQTVSVTSLVKATANTARPAKRSRSKDDSSENENGRTPAPLAVARRNARERNRVRQVNNGFAELRRHIPDEVADAFENANCNRGPNKKMSKVETLRMAVEYIRNLESLLNIGSDKENGSHSFPSPASSSPDNHSLEHSFFSMNSPNLDDDGFEDDDMDSIPTIAQHHYAHISSSDHFRLAGTPVMYEDDETGQPVTPSSDLNSETQFSLDANYHLVNSNEQFCVIRTDCVDETDAIQVTSEELELKYAETVQLANITDGSILLGDIDGLNPQMYINHSDFNYERVQRGLNSISVAHVDNETFNESQELKQEIPELDVTPEDRRQFEETLKWWQEKTQVNVKPVS